MLKLFLIGIIAVFITACNPQQNPDSELKWGHLKDRALTPSSPHFLINKRPGQSYKVCLAEYMAEKFPGIEIEINAAINIWGHYIGRTVPVEITTKELPRAIGGDTSDTLSKKYHEICGEGFDTVLGVSPFEGTAVGVTGTSYSYFSNRDGSINISSFSRYLFLRDYQATPSPWRSEQDWTSLEGRHNEKSEGDRLVDLMVSRDRTEFSSSNRALTLPVLTHEFGHVWGLCDQYEGVDNCDATYSTPGKVTTSIMGASSQKEKLYLTDDDIDGIRALARRDGFSKGWEGSVESLEIPAVEMKIKDIELFKIDEVKSAEDNTLSVTYSIVTNRPARYSFEVKRKGSSRWSPLSGYYESDKVHSITAVMNISLYDDPSKFDVRIKLNLKDENGALLETQYVESE